jgi:hypothetical protein
MILRTIKEYIGMFQLYVGKKIIALGIIIANKGEITGINYREAKLKAHFAPFKDASNYDKEILTIIKEGDLGPIYKN